MLATLHCNVFSSEKLRSSLDVTRAELQDADDQLQSLTQQLATSRQHYQQLQKERQDAEEILRKEVNFKTRNCTVLIRKGHFSASDTISAIFLFLVCMT